MLVDKVDEFDPRGIRRNSKHHLDAAAVARIASACPMLMRQGLTRDQLTSRLNSAVVNYRVASAWQKKPTALQVASRMQRIEKAAAELLRQLGLGATGRSHPDLMPFALRAWFVGHARGGLGISPDDEVRSSVEAVKRIRGWASEYKYRSQRAQIARAMDMMSQSGKFRDALRALETRGEQKRHKADLALDGLVQELGTIWKDATGQAPKAPSTIGGNSKNAGRPAGQFYRFVRAILEHLGLPVRDHGLRERMRRLYSKVRSTAKKI